MKFVRNTKITLVGMTLVSSLAAVACGSEVTTGGAGEQGGSANVVGQGGGNVMPCPVGQLCLDVMTISAVPAGRLGVVWFQIADDGPDPLPVVAYDAPFAGTEASLEIPLSAITPPNGENLLCERACDDESMCPCIGEPQIGIALVVAIMDGNNNGAIDTAEINAGSLYGIGRAMIGYSESSFPAPAPMPFDRLFPEGIAQGLVPYRINSQMPFDTLSLSMPGDRFGMNVCAPPCDPGLPNLN